MSMVRVDSSLYPRTLNSEHHSKIHPKSTAMKSGSIKFHCPGCRKTITTSHVNVGTNGVCPACGTALVVPKYIGLLKGPSLNISLATITVILIVGAAAFLHHGPTAHNDLKSQRPSARPAATESSKSTVQTAETPAGLRGTWDATNVRARITATEYEELTRQSNYLGYYEKGTGIWHSAIKDSDFVVETTYSIRVNANTAPWQIDFTTKTKTGQVVDIKAICELRGDTLKINIGSKGAGRPSSFEQKQDCTLLNYKRMKIKNSE